MALVEGGDAHRAHADVVLVLQAGQAAAAGEGPGPGQGDVDLVILVQPDPLLVGPVARGAHLHQVATRRQLDAVAVALADVEHAHAGAGGRGDHGEPVPPRPGLGGRRPRAAPGHHPAIGGLEPGGGGAHHPGPGEGAPGPRHRGEVGPGGELPELGLGHHRELVADGARRGALEAQGIGDEGDGPGPLVQMVGADLEVPGRGFPAPARERQVVGPLGPDEVGRPLEAGLDAPERAARRVSGHRLAALGLGCVEPRGVLDPGLALPPGPGEGQGLGIALARQLLGHQALLVGAGLVRHRLQALAAAEGVPPCGGRRLRGRRQGRRRQALHPSAREARPAHGAQHSATGRSRGVKRARIR